VLVNGYHDSLVWALPRGDHLKERVGSDLTHKHFSRLSRLAMNWYSVAYLSVLTMTKKEVFKFDTWNSRNGDLAKRGAFEAGMLTLWTMFQISSCNVSFMSHVWCIRQAGVVQLVLQLTKVPEFKYLLLMPKNGQNSQKTNCLSNLSCILCFTIFLIGCSEML
jgi:hypothetical protein